MQTTLTIVCENCAGRSGVIGEHGFAALIETGEATYLFDTGPGLSLPHNAAALEKDMRRVEKIFISHGHYDHTGGLEWAVSQAAPVEVVAHPDIFSRHMNGNPDDPRVVPHYVGCPASRETLAAAGARFQMLDTTREIVPGIHFVTGVARKPGQTEPDLRLMVQETAGAAFHTDPLHDDASLLIQGDHPPVLLLGCAHAGLLNILDHIASELGITRLGAVLGGTHLKFCGSELIEKTIDRLEEFGVQQVSVCHCTGFDAAAILAGHFEDRFSRAEAGTSYRFGR